MTIEKKIRCLLSDANLLKSFYAEAMYIVSVLISLSSSVLLDDDVPERV